MKGLNKLYYIKLDIENLKEEIKNIPEISGLNMDGMPKANTISDAVYSIYLKKERLIEKLLKKNEKYLEELIRIENIIDHIEDAEIRAIARMRFVLNMKWADIGKKIHLDRTACYRKLKHYLDNIDIDKLHT